MKLKFSLTIEVSRPVPRDIRDAVGQMMGENVVRALEYWRGGNSLVPDPDQNQNYKALIDPAGEERWGGATRGIEVEFVGVADETGN